VNYLRIAYLLTLLAAGGFALWYAHHAGYEGATAEWQAKWTARDAADVKAISDRDKAALPEIISEVRTYVKKVAVPVTDAPHVLVCNAAPARRPVQPAAGPGPVADAGPAVREAPPRDIGAPVVTVGRDADALVAGLQTYISRVCLAQP
jgi:hypothetical protein